MLMADAQPQTAALLLEHCRTAYMAEADDWRDVERKAQGTVAIAGIFMAGALVVLRSVQQLGSTESLLLFATILALAITAVVAVMSLLVREVYATEPGQDVKASAQAVFDASDDQIDDAFFELVRERTDYWIEARKSLSDAGTKKAGLVFMAQLLLIVSSARLQRSICLELPAACLFSSTYGYLVLS